MSNEVSTPTLVAESGLHSVIWAEFLAPVLAGDEPIVRQIDLPPHAESCRFDELGVVVADLAGDGWSQLLLAGTGWSALVTRNRHRSGTITVRAADLAAVKAGVALFADRLPEPEPADDRQVAIDFWQVSDEVYRRTRTLEAPAWVDIGDQYPDEVAEAMDGLLATDLETASGRLVLWHGPPGTGKTTALRALARAWVDRCRVQLLLDPERIFSSSTNLFDVVIDEWSDGDGWRLIVVEDADELVRSDAKERVGQSLARLLNLSDGLLGQGLRVLTLITTNEPVDRLHPALVRPGRCLAEIEFRPFTTQEARARWPGRRFGSGPVTLAEALAPVGAGGSVDADAPIGLYL